MGTYETATTKTSPGTGDSLSTVWENLLDLAWPKRCVGCEKLGVLLCADCGAAMPLIDPATACPRCGAPYGVLICSECYDTTGPLALNFSAAVSVCLFESAASRMVVVYKDQHEQRLAALCAEKLVAALPAEWPVWAELISYVPDSKAKQKERGFDHMQLIAQQVAGLLERECSCLLSKQGGSDQRSLNRKERFENLSGALSCTNPELARGRRILLLDDVMTTTATLDAAARVLKDAGAREVRVATLCRVY